MSAIRRDRMSITVHILLSAMRAVKETGLIKGPDTDVDETEPDLQHLS